MMTDTQLDTLRELDRVLKICHTKEGKHVLDELKQAEFYNKLVNEDGGPGALVLLANMVDDAHRKVFKLEGDLYQSQQAVKDIVKMIEQQIMNKGDNSPSEITTLQELNSIRSRHGFLY